MDTFNGRDFSGVRLLGGRLCLDFVNTVDTRYPQFDGEYLTSYNDLLSWSQYVAMLTTDETVTLACIAFHDPDTAEDVFRQAIQLREAFHRIFVAVIHQRVTPEDDLMVKVIRLGIVSLRSYGVFNARTMEKPNISAPEDCANLKCVHHNLAQ